MKYDLIVIGGGPGGYTAAVKAAQSGMKVALVEKSGLGGTCLHRGCIPTKALLHVSGIYREMKDVGELGINLGDYSCDTNKMYGYKNGIVNKLAEGIGVLMKTNKVDVYVGHGVITGIGRVRVDTENELEADNILIATGSVVSLPNISGAELEGVMTSDQLLNGSIENINQLTIIGGGVIGLEFANMFSDLGRKVTIIESADRLIANMDRELSQSITMLFKKRGITVHTSAYVSRIEKSDNGLSCFFSQKDAEHIAKADAVLLAVGRKPYTKGLMENVTLEMVNGAIAVDGSYRTSIDGIYAIGDVIGGIQLAHVASAEGILAVEGMLGKESSIDISTVPSCIYTNPEMAQVGMTADDAKKAELKTKVGKISMASNGRSIIEGVERGFIKLVANEADGAIIGATIMGARATDLISEASLMITKRLTAKEALKVIRPHPTFSEGITEALDALASK